MPRTFKATVCARRWAWRYRRARSDDPEGRALTVGNPKGVFKFKPELRDMDGIEGRHYVEMNPAFKRLLAKLIKQADKPGHTLSVTFREPCADDKLIYAVEVADIVLTFPE